MSASEHKNETVTNLSPDSLADKLIADGYLTKEEYIALLKGYDSDIVEKLKIEANRLRKKYYGLKVFQRGLIEFTNYCKNDCYYCGIRRSADAVRYRLSEDDIISCCTEGYRLGFRTFVLQGGEDPYFTDDKLAAIIKRIKVEFPDCALTLSLGERSYESYKRLKEAGADRYLLRHETANKEHYQKLHPSNMELETRLSCLRQLKELGFQTGAGFMVGSPGQSEECIADDFIFLKELQPHMVGIGPFIPHHDTPFAEHPQGSLDFTLLLLSIVRILLPKVLLPSTTALGTIHKQGRELGLQAGANVVMPNLSPVSVRKKYSLYDNKICTGEEAAECVGCLTKRVDSAGFVLVKDRGDAIS